MHPVDRRVHHRSLVALCAAIVVCLVGLAGPANAAASKSDSGAAVHHDTSKPLRDIKPSTHARKAREADDTAEAMPQRRPGNGKDPVAQTTPASPLAPTPTNSFDGVGQGFSGPQGTFTVNSAPPDTNSAVGPNNVIELVNSAFAIFNKTGTVQYGPAQSNTLWSGFGGGCQTNNDGDGVVRYDPIANRFIITQFSVSTTPYLECLAVSQTGDPTGAYYRYSFSFTNFPDYPKLSVWPDAYYVTYNMFAGGVTFAGAEACAMDRAKMLTGAAATQQCFTTSTSFGGLLSSDLDGPTVPPAGEPNTILGLGTSGTTLAYWKFHVDWTTPGNSTFTGPTNLTVASYSQACGGGTCIPQSGTTTQLDSLADRLMFRLAYRNFGDHESLVVSHSVTSGSSVGVRWYELRMSGSNPTVYQQGTYVPDASYRWMSSIAEDKSGDIALGYSVSSSSLHPGVHYTARLPGDALGTMTQGEGSFVDGAGSQTGTLTRWGDYSSMSVDPSDDCTFWYSTEYIPANGSFNWRTRVGSFKLTSCGTVTNDFSIAVSPTSGSVAAGNGTTATVSTAITSGAAQTVSLSASGLPSGASASFNPTSVSSGGSSTMSISTTTSTAPGTYPITITGTGTSATHSTTYTLTVTGNDYSIAVSPTSGSVTVGGSTTATVSTAVTSGSAQTVNLSATGLPSGASASFNPASVTAGGSSTMTISTSASTPTGTSSITITGTGTSVTHSTTYSLTVNPVAGSGITNGGFETGNLSGWSTVGTEAVTTSTPRTGAYADQGGSTSPTNGDSSVVQTFTVPAGATTLAFWYKMTCPDSVTYDWATATLRDNTTAVTTTPLAKTCATNSAYVQVSVAVTAGDSYTLTLTSHDDNYASDPSYTKFDDVALITPPPPPQNPVQNPGFETGTLASWTTAGTESVTTSTPHTGTYADQGGSTSPTNGDSSVSQTFTIPTGGTTLSFWYKMTCPDSVTYDWATATLRDNTTATTTTPLAKTCATNSAYVKVSVAVTAGHSYTLTMTSHDDNYASDPSYTKFDDVLVS